MLSSPSNSRSKSALGGFCDHGQKVAPVARGGDAGWRNLIVAGEPEHLERQHPDDFDSVLPQCQTVRAASREPVLLLVVRHELKRGARRRPGERSSYFEQRRYPARVVVGSRRTDDGVVVRPDDEEWAARGARRCMHIGSAALPERDLARLVAARRELLADVRARGRVFFRAQNPRRRGEPLDMLS
jgi:hypothetical protein